MPKPVVAIVGRPNVGKSTLFNRLVGERIAIVEEKPGITRDRLYQDTEWGGRTFTLVDTGGLEYGKKGEIIDQVCYQVKIAIDDADVILFVVDGRSGLTVADQEVAQILRRSTKPVILVVNKVDNFNGSTDYLDFYRLGLGQPIPVSALQGLNTGDLLDRVISILPATEEKTLPSEAIKIAVVGRPNVGKSSLVNALLGEERVIVSSIPGTTRDAIDTWFERKGRAFILIDTAGIRRRSRINLAAERYSIIRSLKAIERSDVTLVMFDITEGITEQDKRIVGYVHEKGKAVILVINKWDLMEKNEHTVQEYTSLVRQELSFLTYAPVLFISALTRKGTHRILDLAQHVWEEHSKRINTGALNNFLKEVTMQYPPPARKTKRLKITYAIQGGVRPPTFVLFVNEPELMHFSYLRYLENQLRQAYGFEGTPVRFVLRKRNQ